eukprot:12944418-Alexandrium_andersonii.AAC.1
MCSSRTSEVSDPLETAGARRQPSPMAPTPPMCTSWNLRELRTVFGAQKTRSRDLWEFRGRESSPEFLSRPTFQTQ